ncbi:phosphoethanolamine transferase [Myroides profundi]|uniref:Phosphoethanolamine transferase for glucans (OPG), alkaline phosphatase superfamily n=1 Tax=Myroides profundi TaxID=480520 RepID=A0AAJ4W3B3_MYRPR|nr:phosphoethanolamine transferase [Myroides profundi]AJH13499.1 phosphoethanolamine transferase [Myroides profundi]SEP96662.1 Phosphoethanolamine transferase for glucans (OPG), alkaline phosphatase superfamily [Myroides profundi]
MTEQLNKKGFFSRIINNPIALFWFYIAVNMVPSIYFVFTQPVDVLGKIVVILFPLGLFMTIFSAFKNSGAWLLLCFPFLFLHAFQIVLFYLFGEDVIAADMFLNVATTNTSEINELLGSLLPSIAFVCFLYIPPIVFAILQWKRKNFLDWSFRRQTLLPAVLLLIASLVLSFFSANKNSGTFAFNQDVYPINALHNLGFAVNKWDKVNRYPETSKNFTFKATRDSISTDKRQIYVLIIGETSRADNWSLYGYDRETNPKLKNEKNLVVFKDALTQSNTTHKSVSIILSEAEAENYNSIYVKKGIVHAFKEAGFTTISLSNQAENSSFIEYFTKEADIYKTIRTTDSHTRMTENHYDEELVGLMQKHIQETTGDLFILLHTYGSHFKYMERYPESFRQFTPDEIGGVKKSEKEHLVNAYDNSILYTDHFLAKTIEALKQTNEEVAMLYTSDHGEDLFDDDRNRFLHASPSPTYYQLRIPFLMWFSDEYITNNEKRMTAVQENKNKPISTNAVFHTMINAAHIRTSYLEKDLSLVNRAFNAEARMYLNDHDIAVPYTKMNLKKEDFEMLKKNNIKE